MNSTLGTIGQIAVAVSDLPRSIAFYRDALGLPFLFDAPNVAFFDCGGIRLMLGLQPEAPVAGNTVIYFRVTALREQHQRLAAAGVRTEGEPHLVARLPDHDLWMAFFRDPDGNLFGMMEELSTSR